MAICPICGAAVNASTCVPAEEAAVKDCTGILSCTRCTWSRIVAVTVPGVDYHRNTYLACLEAIAERRTAKR